MGIASRFRRERTNAVGKIAQQVFNAPGSLPLLYGKHTLTVGGRGAPGNAPVPGNYANTNPSTPGTVAGYNPPVPGNTVPGNTNPTNYNPTLTYPPTYTPGNYNSSFYMPGNPAYAPPYSYTLGADGYIDAPYGSSPGDLRCPPGADTSYETNDHGWQYSMICTEPGYNYTNPGTFTPGNANPGTYTVGYTVPGNAVPGNTNPSTTNPSTPGTANYNPSVPGNANYNPTTPGVAGTPFTTLGVTFPGGAVGTVAPVVGDTMVFTTYSQTPAPVNVGSGAYVIVKQT